MDLGPLPHRRGGRRWGDNHVAKFTWSAVWLAAIAGGLITLALTEWVL